MKIRKHRSAKICMALILMISAFLVVPQFSGTVYAGYIDAPIDTSIGASYGTAMEDSSWNITHGGNYSFTGTTDKNNIKVSTTEPVTITLKSVSINLGAGKEYPAINVQDNARVTIKLEGENYLHGGKHDGAGKDDGYAGIKVSNSAELTILGNGSLEAVGWQGQRGAAGIGGDYGHSCGKVTIGNGSDSPTVIARGGGVNGGDDGAAGIGGGYDGQANNGIIINSGTVTATGGNGAAGIGGGQGYATGSGGKVTGITINGGTVTATGGEDAPGIGAGESGSSGEGGDCYNLTINGGNITATGGASGAGIGGSKEGFVQNLVINGGTINAKGGSNAAGIGAGNAKGTGDGGNIDNLKITGGNITATGGSAGAGIGGGDSSKVTDLVIDQAEGRELKINATGGSYGAGIGTASNDIEDHRLGTLDITLRGGEITATGGSGGAGIGSGGGSASNFNILGYGTINATGYNHSSAIGAGDGNSLGAGDGKIVIKGNSDTQRLVINGKADCTNVNQTGGNSAAVIGSANGTGGDIEISYADLTLDSSEGSYGAAIGSGRDNEAMPPAIGSITIRHCNITDKALDRVGPSIGVGECSDMKDILIEDTTFKGGAIGGCDNSNELLTESAIDSITIRRSNITADSNKGTKAAIGSGAYLGIKKITIEDSEVTAEAEYGAAIGSGGYKYSNSGDPFKWTGCECGDITISNSKVSAISRHDGAGIGGGWGTSVGKITIENGSDVTAISNSEGAAIGGGHAESCGDITISDSKVTADASETDYSAGIGSSGDNDGAAVLWNSTCHSITITNSTVDAKGGTGSAAIGTAQESQFGSGSTISITGSTVNAAGGEGAAGIGAGSDSWGGAGGEAPDIKIIGKSKVTATGGSGGAGIGGGCSGGADNITIDLEDTKRISNGDDWEYYVKAYGGQGAAGIGGGSIYQDSDWIAENGHDVESVTISGGYVYAQGGSSKSSDLGPGAGIGGGAHGGNLNGFKVEGGFVEAHAGNQYAGEGNADDIGSGGNDTRPSAEDEDFVIKGGTVLGGLSDDPDEIIIDGGSVRHTASNVKRSDGTKVYQTKMKVEDKYYEPSDFAVTSYEAYGKNDIFSDENGRIYLYLPESDKDKATAEYNSNGTFNKYYGTTTSDNNGWLKMDGVLKFRETKEHAVNEEFILELDDAELNGTVSFVLEQNSPSGKCIGITAQNNASPGAWIKLKATDRVTYTVTASADSGNFDSEMYWSAEGSFSESITKQGDEVLHIEVLSKVYDGVPVEDPAVTLKSGRTDAVITYKYYDANGTYLGNGVKPVNAGEYSVEAIVEGNQQFTGAETRQSFEISKREIMLATEPYSSGTSAAVRILAMNAVDYPGSVKIKINDGNVIEKEFVEENGFWAAAADFEEVPVDVEYKIVSEYDGSNNYLGDTDELLCYKDRANRELRVNDLTAVYGDASGVLNTELTADNDSSQNKYTFEIAGDFSNQSDSTGRVKPTIRLVQGNNSAVVHYQNAGYAVVKVTVSHPLYNDAIAYAAVTVGKKTLKVTSYAYEGNNTSDRVKELTYGNITENLSYGLEYVGFIEGDNPDNAFESGSLAAVPLAETAQAGEHSIRIIKQKGTPIIIGPNIKWPPFYSRNYELDLQPGTVTVCPATLYIDINDATGQYGMNEPEYSAEFGDADGNYGLMSWDSEETVIQAIGPEKAFSEYKPGVYEEEITVAASAGNYKFEDADGNPTIHKGTLTVEKGRLSVDISVPSYVYDGTAAEAVITAEPVAATGVDPDGLAAPGAYELVFYEEAENGETVKLDGAPKDTGEYIAEVIFGEDDYYNKASAEEHFQILKAHCDVETPQVPDMYISEGLQLSDQPLPEGWAWVDGSKELAVGSVREEAVYTPEDTRNYYTESAMISFNVIKHEAEITITEDPSKVYDGKAVNDPDVSVTSDAEVKYIYYDVTNGTELGSSAPVNAGEYTVTAAVEETDMYKSAQSETVSFIIDKRDVALSITAEENIAGDSASVEMTVDVIVPEGIALDEGSEIMLDIKDVSGKYSETITASVEYSDGRYAAVFDFTKAAASHYVVTAVFEETNNFNSAETSRAFDKEPGERNLDVTIEHTEYMNGNVIRVPYGTEPEIMTAIPSVEAPYGDSHEDEYYFRVVAESAAGTVSLAETGETDKRKLTFENAGTAIIEVKVTNETFYSDAVTYVVVTVEKCEAKVESYAYADLNGALIPTDKVQYGLVDTLNYGLKYSDEMDGVGTDVLAVMETIALNETAGVNTEGWPVKVIKSGDTEQQKKVLRNYDLTINEGRVYVTPAPLVLTADDVTVKYGHEAEFTLRADGLMSWDNLSAVAESAGPEEDYSELIPGRYDIKVTAKENANYDIATVDGTLTIEKADVELAAAVESKVYDGKPVTAEITVEPDVAMDPAQLEKTAEPEVTYYQISDDGETIKLSAAPENVGTYYAEVTVPENKCYNEAAARADFSILKAVPDVKTPEVPDMYIKEGLKLSDQELPEGWAWLDGSKALELGHVSEKAEYTPEDTGNYKTVVRNVEFEVIINPAKISITENPSKVYDGTAVKEPAVVKTTDAEEVTYTYYDTANNNALGSTAPVKAGKYTVTASVAETGLYTSAESEPVTFVIEKRDVVLAMTAEENIDGDIAKAKITVEVLGTDGVALDEGSEITLDVSEASGEYSRVSTEAVRLVDGRYIAEFSFTRAAANHYDVKAVFAETENFNVVETEQAFDKEAGERTVHVVPEHAEYMSGKTITVTYGTEPETVTAVPSVKHDGDKYSFEIVSDPLGKFAEPTISLSDADSEDRKQIVFENAGTAVIKVTVSNEDYYADAITYVIVKVMNAEPDKPEDPSGPAEPEIPDGPSDPTEPVEPDDEPDSDKDSDEASRTGDDFNMIMWMLILLTSGAICIVMINLRKRTA